MDSLLAMPPNFQPQRMDPVDIDRIGFLAVPEKEISPASSLPGFFLSSPPVFLSVFFETFYQQYLATFLSLHITIDSGLARASLLPTSRATTFTTYQQVHSRLFFHSAQKLFSGAQPFTYFDRHSPIFFSALS
ncbi:hypothetical protein FOCG_14632 [Fusarium oxysporum f. sp. radicis-lycopersici 26381]|nr:hypothetical protein FOCG_14632 [Fusarium oxysporum f. sp. radicis-lycopersici 26381]EXL43131.1 hypothetical protein FOCG_14632 [Fusarium oxysporum f. sp. radicis-lycopersici 26381]